MELKHVFQLNKKTKTKVYILFNSMHITFLKRSSKRMGITSGVENGESVSTKEQHKRNLGAAEPSHW